MSELQAAVIQREAARVILLTPAGEVLLQEMQADSGRCWIVPGGGLGPGETHEEAACRELAEEVGHEVAELGPWVWARTAHFSFRGRRYRQRERFYVAWAEPFEFDRSGQEEVEREIVIGHRWWGVDEIEAAAGEVFYPSSLAALLRPLVRGDLPGAPIEVV